MPSSSRSRFNVGGSTRIVLNDLSCTSSMWSLSSCYRSTRESFSCRSDVVMSCHPNATSAGEGSLRLVRSTFRSHMRDTKGGAAGYLQVFYQGRWGTVCDDGFDYVASRVACKQLGFSTDQVGYSTSLIGIPYRNTPTVLDNLRCRGGESKLQFCSRNVLLDSNCRHSEDIILDCDDETQPARGSMSSSIRLSNSNVAGTGVVQLQSSGRWESVCDTFFSAADGAVACRQLGYDPDRSVVLPRISFNFLSSARRIDANHDGVRCYGNESSLFQCTERDCSSVDDVAISCVGNKISGASNIEMFQIAIAMNDDEEVERFLKSGLSPNTRFERCCDERWRTPFLRNAPALTCATCYGSSGSVEALLRHGASIDATDSYSAGTALSWAAAFSHPSIASQLISLGANVNISNLISTTPLHYAALSGNVEILKMLVNAGANTGARDSEGDTPEDLADEDAEFAAAYFQSLRGGPIVREQFFPAIAIRDTAKVTNLLRQGVNPNSVAEKCCTLIGAPAISCAVCVQSLEIVELLIDNSAMVDKRDLIVNGTALIWASRAGNLQIVRLLVQSGANVNAFTGTGKDTPLHWAAFNGHFEVVKYLVGNGANVNALQSGFSTAASLATGQGHFEIAQYLLARS